MAKKKISPVETLRSKIEDEGFDHAVAEYSDWGEILDEEFHRLRETYLEVKSAFMEYVDSMDEPDEETDE